MHCDACGLDRVVEFRSKGRGFCRSCGSGSNRGCAPPAAIRRARGSRVARYEETFAALDSEMRMTSVGRSFGRAFREATMRVALAFALAAAQATPAAAANVTTGRAYVLLDLEVFAEWGLTLDGFIGAEGNALPVGPLAGEDLLDTTNAEVTSPQVHTLNSPGVDVTPDPRRRAPPTGFVYSAATLPASASGAIALAGVSRWTVDPAQGGGKLLFGDYALSWNASTSQWVVSNYIDFSVPAFTLANAQMTTGPGDAFSVSGDLIGTSSLALLLAGASGRDFGHFAFSTIEIACADGIDDDGDGLVDLADPGCADVADASERGVVACDDGIDDDGDGGIDFHLDADLDGFGDSPGDLGCAAATGVKENPKCQDGIDNDAQTGTDWDGGLSAGVSDPNGADPQCVKPTRDRETPSSCGVGGEVALLLPLLRAAARRARVTRDGSGSAR
jgi:hypothetical protein